MSIEITKYTVNTFINGEKYAIIELNDGTDFFIRNTCLRGIDIEKITVENILSFRSTEMYENLRRL